MQTNEPKLLSVVIPAYNAEHFLACCLDSMLQSEWAYQTELLVVNDGSKDATAALADAYEQKFPGIVKAIHKENGGHGSAVNAGIAAAAGKYFKVVDSDDTVEPGAYNKFIKALQKTECDLIATPFTCVRQQQNKLTEIQTRQIEGADGLPREKVISFQKAAENLHIRMHECTFRTAILKEHSITLSEHSFYVDMQYILYPVPWIKTICIMKYPVYRYRLGDENQSVSVKNMQKNRGQHFMVMCSLIDYYRKREAAGDPKAVLSYLARGIAKMEANQVQITLSMPIGKKSKTELMRSEKKLKKECPAAFAANEKTSLKLLRKSGYLLYPAAAVAWRLVKKQRNI